MSDFEDLMESVPPSPDVAAEEEEHQRAESGIRLIDAVESGQLEGFRRDSIEGLDWPEDIGDTITPANTGEAREFLKQRFGRFQDLFPVPEDQQEEPS